MTNQTPKLKREVAQTIIFFWFATMATCLYLFAYELGCVGNPLKALRDITEEHPKHCPHCGR